MKFINIINVTGNIINVISNIINNSTNFTNITNLTNSDTIKNHHNIYINNTALSDTSPELGVVLIICVSICLCCCLCGIADHCISRNSTY